MDEAAAVSQSPRARGGVQRPDAPPPTAAPPASGAVTRSAVADPEATRRFERLIDGYRASAEQAGRRGRGVAGLAAAASRLKAAVAALRGREDAEPEAEAPPDAASLDRRA